MQLARKEHLHHRDMIKLSESCAEPSLLNAICCLRMRLYDTELLPVAVSSVLFVGGMPGLISMQMRYSVSERFYCVNTFMSTRVFLHERSCFAS